MRTLSWVLQGLACCGPQPILGPGSPQFNMLQLPWPSSSSLNSSHMFPPQGSRMCSAQCLKPICFLIFLRKAFRSHRVQEPCTDLRDSLHSVLQNLLCCLIPLPFCFLTHLTLRSVTAGTSSLRCPTVSPVLSMWHKAFNVSV